MHRNCFTLHIVPVNKDVVARLCTSVPSRSQYTFVPRFSQSSTCFSTFMLAFTWMYESFLCIYGHVYIYQLPKLELSPKGLNIFLDGRKWSCSSQFSIVQQEVCGIYILMKSSTMLCEKLEIKKKRTGSKDHAQSLHTALFFQQHQRIIHRNFIQLTWYSDS